MAYMNKITVPQHGSAAPVVRMMRRYAALRDRITDREDDLADLVAFGGTLGFSATAGVAIASLFEITEAVVGRPLRPACCASATLSIDEVAILRLLSTNVPLDGQGSYEIPHGLPGALAWAVVSTKRLCDGFANPADASVLSSTPVTCRFVSRQKQLPDTAQPLLEWLHRRGRPDRDKQHSAGCLAQRRHTVQGFCCERR